MSVWETCPPVGGAHKNGDRIYGLPVGYARDLWAAGTPMVSSLVRSTVTSLVRGVDVHDRLDVRFDGKFWWAERGGDLVGRLSWSLRMTTEPSWVDGKTLAIRDGVLEVRTVTVSSAGVVVNCGGFVTG